MRIQSDFTKVFDLLCTTMAETQTLTLSDGRTLAWCEHGNPLSPSPPIIYFHSMPSSRLEGAIWRDLALQHNLRIITPDRPGMGLSSPHPNLALLSYSADILALITHLKIPQFRVLSVSGGGPYALSCLYSLPATQCLGGQIVASLYPTKLGLQGMSLSHRAVLFFSYWTPSFLGWLLNWQLGSAARNPDKEVLKRMFLKSAKSLPKRDQEAIEREDFGPAMLDACRESFRQGGSEGIARESYLLSLDWGFELEDIEMEGREVTIWHGKDDMNCPFGMVEKAAGLMEDAATRWVEGEGHGSLIAYHREEIIRGFSPSVAA
jgi:pimeloyl-ACP methyl ester carboxylesterase